jgi:peptidoglycan/LPS O-acetylase OafA/YrhL
MFVTISCSGLPDQSSCTFTPENIEIPINATAPINSTLVLATQTGTLTTAKATDHRDTRSIAWALLPGSLLMAAFAFGARRRRFLRRLSLLGLVALVSVLGTTACSPLYNYYNHGPTHNLPTPAGNYTVTIAAQSSDGVTATTQKTTLALTVTQ